MDANGRESMVGTWWIPSNVAATQRGPTTQHGPTEEVAAAQRSPTTQRGATEDQEWKYPEGKKKRPVFRLASLETERNVY
jgi:hypothetical protein